MGTRFLAVLAAMTLGASGAFVGYSMASGSWEELGTELAPGEGYALRIGDQTDRMKLELTNAGSDPQGLVAVFSPTGIKAGVFTLDSGARAAEIVTDAKGVWTIFVYKAQGADLSVSVHGAPEAARFAAANVERRDVSLGMTERTASVEQTFTAILDKEPVLAGVYLQGSARGFQSVLRTEKGIVEVVTEQQVSAANSGVIVESKGERITSPQNLVAGPFTATVNAESISGKLVLRALYLSVDSFVFDEPAPDAEGAQKERQKQRDHAHAHAQAPKPPRDMGRPGKAPMLAQEFAECGELRPYTPFALTAERGGVLRLALEEDRDPWVTIFDPDDGILDIIQLEPARAQDDEDESDEHEHEDRVAGEAMVHLPMPGEYVLYARGAPVQVGLLGAEECELLALDVDAIPVAMVSGDLVGTEAAMAFELPMAPLEFGIHLEGAHTAAVNLRALFNGPEGEAAWAGMNFGLGVFGNGGSRGGGMLGGLGPLDWFGLGPSHGGEGKHQGMAFADAEKMLPGEYLLEVQADVFEGDLVAYALHYVRGSVEGDEDDGGW